MLRGVYKKKEKEFDPFFANPAGIQTEFDPVVKLSALVRLEEISRCREFSLRILRCNRSGVSVYVHPHAHDETAARQCRYIVAYEGEVSAAVHVKQILIQSNSATSVWAVLNLVEQYAWALSKKLCALPPMTQSPLAENLEKLGGFHLGPTRKAVRTALAPLSEANLTKDAYKGFINAVISLTS